MATVVELGAVEGFILDDPVAGVLGNTVYTLGGTVFKDITSRVISIGSSRGKNRDLDRFSAGSLTFLRAMRIALLTPSILRPLTTGRLFQGVNCG